MDERLFAGLAKSLTIEPQTMSYWVEIHEVCSRNLIDNCGNILKVLVFDNSYNNNIELGRADLRIISRINYLI